MRLTRIVAGVLALCFVFGPALLWIGGTRPTAFENHELASRPSLGDGWKAFDAAGPWATDHLPGRVDAVHANSWIDYFVLGTLPSSGTRSSVASSAGAGTARPGRAQTPTVVRGKRGYLFLGHDFDQGCDDGPAFRRGLRALARAARTIEASGRTVRFAVGPNKPSVTRDDLPRAVPRGDCAVDGIAAQDRTMDRFVDPNYVAVRSLLAQEHARGHQVYWKTDTHWSPAGAAVYAQGLGTSLEPAMAERLRVTHPELTKTGDLMDLAGLTFKETVRAARLDAGGEVAELEDSDHFDVKKPVYGVNRWETSPATGLVPGRTLLVGDSFTYFGLGVLRPLFAHGTFMWTGRVSDERMAREMRRSRTVVLQVVQRNLVTNVPGKLAKTARLAFPDRAGR